MTQTKVIPPMNNDDIPGYLYYDFLDFVNHHAFEDNDDRLNDPYAYSEYITDVTQLALDWICEIHNSNKYYGEQN